MNQRKQNCRKTTTGSITMTAEQRLIKVVREWEYYMKERRKYGMCTVRKNDLEKIVGGKVMRVRNRIQGKKGKE